MAAVKTAARKGRPIPQVSPAAIAMKTERISFAVPGAERKRTSEKVPATATPAPMLPLTIRITVATTAGRRESARAKPLLQDSFFR